MARPPESTVGILAATVALEDQLARVLRQSLARFRFRRATNCVPAKFRKGCDSGEHGYAGDPAHPLTNCNKATFMSI